MNASPMAPSIRSALAESGSSKGTMSTSMDRSASAGSSPVIDPWTA
jgi:hypothetical protein